MIHGKFLCESVSTPGNYSHNNEAFDCAAATGA